MDVVTPDRLSEQKRDLGPHCATYIRGQDIDAMTREELIFELRAALAREHQLTLDKHAPFGTGSRAVFSERR